MQFYLVAKVRDLSWKNGDIIIIKPALNKTISGLHGDLIGFVSICEEVSIFSDWFWLLFAN